MAAVFPAILLLFSSIFHEAGAQSRQSNITLNSSLSPTGSPSFWPSPSARFAIGFYPKGSGYAVGVWMVRPSGERLVVWTANRDGPPASDKATLVLTSEGKLVLRNGGGGGGDIVISSTAEEPAASAAMLDTGNFVLYNSDSNITWATFQSPTDTLLGSQRLISGKELISAASETNHSSGRFRMKMQLDGNLVAYPVYTTDTAENSYYSTATNLQGNNVTLHLNEDGSMFLLNTNGSNVRNLTTPFGRRSSTTIYRATLGTDGLFRLYSHQFDRSSSYDESQIWSLPLSSCEVKGICGPNSYCTQEDTLGRCHCPPDFAFIDPANEGLGCRMNFASGQCGAAADLFEMKAAALKSDTYAILSGMSLEGCKEECLLDCSCEAASYNNGDCSKLKLPMQYWRRKPEDTTTAFVKHRAPAVGEKNSSLITKIGDGNGVPKTILIVGIALVSFSIFALALSGSLMYRLHRMWRSYKIVFAAETYRNGVECEDMAAAPRPFTYAELEQATAGFSEELGSGAFGSVFKGTLPVFGQVIAVKRLHNLEEAGEMEFQSEIRAIGRTHHRNLVRLLGFCVEGSHRLVVYEYMANVSLAQHIFTPERRPTWEERVRIAKDVARAILYLHEECDSAIIHCDVKPQNILLDESNRAKVSDFGMAKFMKQDQSRTYTRVRGTKGYIAPEWHRNSPVTVKTDVYSFGIVLLQIVCCRRSFEPDAAEEEAILSEWVHACFAAGELGRLVGSDEVDRRRLERMVKVGLWCIQDEPSLRPSMKKVVLMLEGTVEIPTPPPPDSAFSAV